MKRVKMGVVGCGFPFFFHTANAEDSKYVEYTAVYDIDYEKACDVAESYSCNEMTAYTSLEEMLKADIDAVLVSVPHYQHEEVVIKCLDAGKHVLCEKPMATSLEGCQEMADAARRNNVLLMIAENHRFLPAHNWIHDTIAEGLIGDINIIRSHEGCDELEAIANPDCWKMDLQKSGGGVLLDQAVHKFSTLEYIVGDRVETVFAMVSKQVATLEQKADDNAMCIAIFKNGVMAEITVSCTQINNASNSLEVYGTEGSIIECHDNENPVKIYSEADKAGDNQYEWYTPEIPHGENPIYYYISGRNCDDHFGQCIIEGKEPDFTLEDAESAVECCLAGYLSFLEGRPVKREEVRNMVGNVGTKSIINRLAGKIPTKNK